MKKTNIIVVGFCLLIGAVSGAQASRACNISGEKPIRIYREYPNEFPTATLKDFGVVVNNGIYRGSRPNRPDDFRFLQKLGVKNILTLEIADFNQDREEKRAAPYGIHVESAAIEASPISPSKKSVDKVLNYINNPANWPVYVHCNFGKHRTGAVLALYRVIDEGCSKADTIKEMEDFGYLKSYFPTTGLRRYFENNSK